MYARIAQVNLQDRTVSAYPTYKFCLCIIENTELLDDIRTVVCFSFPRLVLLVMVRVDVQLFRNKLFTFSMSISIKGVQCCSWWWHCLLYNLDVFNYNKTYLLSLFFLYFLCCYGLFFGEGSI